MSHIDGGERLGQRADLVDLDQDRIADALLDTALQAFDIGDEKVVADELNFRAEGLCREFPARPVVFGQTVLDRNDGVGGDKLGEILDLLLDRARLAFASIDVGAILEEFAGGGIERDGDVLAGLEARAFDRLDAIVKRRLRRWQVRCEPPSSPTAVFKPAFFSCAFSAWNSRRPSARLRAGKARRAA